MHVDCEWSEMDYLCCAVPLHATVHVSIRLLPGEMSSQTAGECHVCFVSSIFTSLRRKAATDNMLCIVEDHPNWPVHADVFEHPPPRLASRRPIWSDMTSVDTITQWREDWSSASVVNHTIVTDPTIRQPGFDLPRHTWSLLNRFRTGQGQCRANLHKWGLAQSPSCDCGQRQTMSHIVDMCPLTKFEGGLNLLHEVDDAAVI